MFLDCEKIKSLRADKGYTQAQLAELCGLSARTIQRVERDGIASQETTSALASVFELDRTQLFINEQPSTGGSSTQLKVSFLSALIALADNVIGLKYCSSILFTL